MSLGRWLSRKTPHPEFTSGARQSIYIASLIRLAFIDQEFDRNIAT
jgi:hypothetical protein